MRSRRFAPVSPYFTPSSTLAGRVFVAGFSLLELLLALAMAGILMAALGSVLSATFAARDEARTHAAVNEAARFALERITRAVQGAGRLLVPLAENPTTAWSESVREPGVLAVTLDPILDRDRDGWADANNDKDYQDLNSNAVRDAGEPERIDEDASRDNTNDAASGIVGIDDDGDGTVDEGVPDGGGYYSDNDEDGAEKEDPEDGADNDGDGAVDEDLPRDHNNDGHSGVAGVDDDGDGLTDEAAPSDDDEDDSRDEDWFDSVVFYLSGSDLVERIPVPWDENASGTVTGTDYVERTIASNVTQFRITRTPAPAGGPPLLEVSLQITEPGGATANFDVSIRLEGGR